MDEIIRKIDELGRINIPIEAREKLGIIEGDTLEIKINDDNIEIRKYE